MFERILKLMRLGIGAAVICTGALVQADCVTVDASGKKTPFDGKSLYGLVVEKKSLVLLNKFYPSLNVIEMTFKGELTTCGTCSEKYVSCKEDQDR